MLESGRQAYVLLGGLDPAADFAAGAGSLGAAETVIAVTTHLPESLKALVHVVLPIGSFAETSGTYVNIEGRWQSWRAAARLVGESRPGWKVLRVLANLLNVSGFEYDSSEQVRDALKSLSAAHLAAAAAAGTAPPAGAAAQTADAAAAGVFDGAGAAAGAWVDVPVYQVDALVRRSEALAKTKDGQAARAAV
jgi:NADH-quinone oxidoreductase subunit G